MGKLYTIEETAKYLALSESTIRNWIFEGKLKALKVGRAVRISEEAIQEVIKPLEPKESRRD